MNRAKSWGVEAKVGVFVLAALLLLGYMSLRVGKFSFVTWGEQFPLQARFTSVSGLAENGRVEIAGVEVGRIKAIHLSDGRALVDLLLRPGLDLRQDAQARIRTKGMLGEKYIELELGSPDNPALPAGGVISRTESAVEFDQLLSKVPALLDDFRPILNDVRAVSQTLQRVIGTTEGETSLKEILENFNQASKSLSQVARGLERGEGTLGKLLKDDGLYREVQGVVREVQSAAKNLTAFSDKLARGDGTIAKLVNDKGLYEQANQAITRLNRVAHKIDAAEGTLGKLVNDKSLYDDAKKAVKNVNQAMEGIKEQSPVTMMGVVGSTVLR
ncbi:MlaD family protein [Desulfobacca acetoxidans]|uniref:Mammalian cell entry related domain protein n=1 Tax=Desulfobacca acetoxidans (strain ATCC 700848 / DSM 11109 / ASRB2) TaxID=880072 RepID=F2NGX9_DESAR|nr:MlaD family protein [Desulfobacca acetoxidans]AEB08750.1 Mammalian cell entry related domain protein [Desulfobacca acetoxidans DSM 11109]